MNLVEALNVAITYKGESFTPPSRTIDDLVLQIKQADSTPSSCNVCEGEVSFHQGFDEYIKRMALKGIALSRRGDSENGVKNTQRSIELLDKELKQNKNIPWKTQFKVFSLAMQVYESLGRYSQAIHFGERARDVLNSGSPQGKASSKTVVFSQLAHHYARAGRIDKAEDIFKEAENAYRVAIEFNRGENHPYEPIWHGAKIYASAHIFQAKGNLTVAEEKFREAMTWFDLYVPNNVGRQNQMYIEARGFYLVEVLLEQGRISEAELESRESIKHALDFFGKSSPGTASAIMGLSKVMMARGRNKDAKTLASISNGILKYIQADRSSSYYTQSLNLIAESNLANGDYQSALKAFAESEEGAKKDVLTRQAFIDTNLNYAITLLKNNQLNKALKIALNAEQSRKDIMGVDHYSVFEARSVISIIEAKRSNSIRSINDLQKLIPELARGVSDSAFDQVEGGVTQTRFRIIVEEYLELLANNFNHSSEIIESMYQAVQFGSSQKIQHALSTVATRASVQDPELAVLIRQEQNASFKIDAAYNSLARGMSESIGAGENKLEQVKNLRSALSSIRNEISSKYPEYENLVRPVPSSVSEVKQSLKVDEAIVNFHFGETQSYVWVIPKVGKAKFSVIPLGKNVIDSKVVELRKALDSNPRTIRDIPDFNLKLAHELYTILLKPVETAWINAKTLIFVPNGKLATLPLGTLVTRIPKNERDKNLVFDRYRKVSWLAMGYSISYLPSVGSLKTLGKFEASKAKRLPFAGFGNPIFGNQSTNGQSPRTQVAMRGGDIQVRGLRLTKKGNLDSKEISSVSLDQLMPLPETEAEITQIAAALGANPAESVFVRASANEQTVKTMSLKKYRILMFASHALIPGDLDGLEQPAIALSSPSASNSIDDGLLTMSEILNLELNADWTVLSACNTGAASGQGADAISGLGMAFFYAGSRALLVSHWPVETHSARQMTTNIFKNQNEDITLSRVGTISKAVREMITTGEYKVPSSGKAIYSYSHPMFWAPFTLVGDRGL